MYMLMVGNWKAYVESTDKAKKLYAEAKKLSRKGSVEIVIAPPTAFLGIFAPTNKSNVGIGAQDLSAFTGGAATGESTASLLAHLGVSHVILGHSERRAMGETDEAVAEKVRHALANKITPIVCVGERERDADAKYLNMLRAQIAAVFSPLSLKDRMKVIVAYEPIWAIGKSAAEAITPADLREMVLYIRKVLNAYVAGRAVEKIPVLYGGSVEPGNVTLLARESGIDGVLVGRASVDTDSFSALVKAMQ